MHIGILGGSFDPPHLGHLLISMQVKEKLNLDKVWLMPAFHHPLNKSLSDLTHRFHMVKYLENDFISVSDFEIEHNQQSYTIDTLNALHKKHPEHIFYWITGTDQIESFQKYKNWKEIIEKHNLVIFPREILLPHLMEYVMVSLQLQTIPKNVICLHKNLVMSNISSTLIRNRVASGLSIHDMVPDKVEEYIYEHRLYK